MNRRAPLFVATTTDDLIDLLVEELDPFKSSRLSVGLILADGPCLHMHSDSVRRVVQIGGARKPLPEALCLRRATIC